MWRLPALNLLLALPLVTGLVGQNRFYGVRTCRTKANEQHWYIVNRLSGVLMSLSAVVSYAGLWFAAPTNQVLAMAWVLAPLGAALIATFVLDKVLWQGDTPVTKSNRWRRWGG